MHVHGQRDFGFGFDSTSHVEDVWGILKQELKNLYVKIRFHNFLYYLWESEFKYKYRNLSNEKKLEQFFAYYNLIKDSDYDFDSLKSDDFLNNEDLNINFYEDYDSSNN